MQQRLRQWLAARGSRRIIAIASLLGTIAVALIVSASVASAPPALTATRPTQALPISTAWFCPATDARNGGFIVATNSADTPVSGTAALVGANGAQATASLTVPALSTFELRPAELISETIVATTVTFAGTGVTVAHQFVADAPKSTPCSPDAATEWHFPEATTQSNASLSMVLYNPFTDSSVVDLSFATNAGTVSPSDLQSLVVPAHGITTVDISTLVTRRDWLAPHVQARSGRVTAQLLQSAQGQAPHAVSGTPVLASTWSFAPEAVVANASDRLIVFNPADAEIGVTVIATAGNGVPVEPFVLRVPAEGRVAIDLDKETRMPRDVPVGLMVRSDNPSQMILASRATGAGLTAAPGTADYRLGVPQL